MRTVIVTDREQEWFQVPDAAVVAARRYLAEPQSAGGAGTGLLNFCRTGRYQGRGYYVSLLAQARGQRPLPDVKAVEDLNASSASGPIDFRMMPPSVLDHKRGANSSV
jgi:hypothetical protein